MTHRMWRFLVLDHLSLARCLPLLFMLLAGAVEASPAPATGPAYPERMSTPMEAAYRRAPVTNPRAGELIDVGDREYAANQFVEAEQAYRQALDYVDPGRDALARAQIFVSRGGALQKLGQAREAGRLLREATEVFVRMEGEDSLRAGIALLQTSALQDGEEDFDAADQSALRAYGIFQRRLGAIDGQTLIALRAAVRAQLNEGAADRLRTLLQPKLAAIESPASVASESQRAYFNRMAGEAFLHLLRDKEAATYFRLALEHYGKATPATPGDVADCKLALGEALIHLNQRVEAQKLIVDATRYFRTQGNPMASGSGFYELAKMYLSLEDYPNATKAYEDAVASYLKSKDRDTPLFMYRAHMMESVAICKGGDCARAEKMARIALDRLRLLYPNNRFTADAYETLGVILQTEKKYLQAAAAFRSGGDLSKALGAPAIIVVQTGMTTGLAYYAAEKLPEATAAFQTAVDEASAARIPRQEVVADTKEMLGELLYSEGRIPEAEKVLLSAGEDYDALPGEHPRGILQVFFLGLVGYAIGKPGAAANEVEQLLQIFDNPNHLGGLVLTQKLRAQALAETGHSDDAKKALQQATDICAAHKTNTELACNIIDRPNWILRCPPCSAKTRATSIELLRALNAYGFSIAQT